MNLLITSLESFRREQPDMAELWLREGPANVDLLRKSQSSEVVGVPRATLDNPSRTDQRRILSYLIHRTIQIQFTDIPRATRLLEVGTEAREKVRQHYENTDTPEHNLWAGRTTFTREYPSDRVEEHNICILRGIVGDLDERLQEDLAEVLQFARKNAHHDLIDSFNSPPAEISRNDRINNFHESAQLLTLIGNVTTISYEEGVEMAIDYYENLQVEELAPPALA